MDQHLPLNLKRQGMGHGDETWPCILVQSQCTPTHGAERHVSSGVKTKTVTVLLQVCVVLGIVSDWFLVTETKRNCSLTVHIPTSYGGTTPHPYASLKACPLTVSRPPGPQLPRELQGNNFKFFCNLICF